MLLCFCHYVWPEEVCDYLITQPRGSTAVRKKCWCSSCTSVNTNSKDQNKKCDFNFGMGVVARQVCLCISKTVELLENSLTSVSAVYTEQWEKHPISSSPARRNAWQIPIFFTLDKTTLLIVWLNTCMYVQVSPLKHISSNATVSAGCYEFVWMISSLSWCKISPHKHL